MSISTIKIIIRYTNTRAYLRLFVFFTCLVFSNFSFTFTTIHKRANFLCEYLLRKHKSIYVIYRRLLKICSRCFIHSTELLSNFIQTIHYILNFTPYIWIKIIIHNFMDMIILFIIIAITVFIQLYFPQYKF